MSSTSLLRRHAWRVRSAVGQATSEYLVITGVIGGMAIAASSLLGASLRAMLQHAAQRMLAAITGAPGVP